MIHTGIIGGASAITGIMGGSDNLNGTNTAIDAVTDKGLTDVRGHKSGAFNSSSFEDKRNYSEAISSNVIANGNISMGATHDINTAGSVILSGENTTLAAGHDVNLGTVTNTVSSYAEHKSSGLLQKENLKDIPQQSEEIGTLVGAGKNISISAGHDLNVAGTVTGKEDVNLVAGNNIATTALKDTTSNYHHESKSGLGASFNGGMASIGYHSMKQTDTSKTVHWTPSEISAGHDLNLVSGGSSTFTGTDLSAGNDLNISGSSVNFNTVNNTVEETHKRSSVFAGLSVGLSGDSAAGQAARSGQSASDMHGKGSAAGRTLNAMQGGYVAGNALATNGNSTGGGLISGTAALGFNVGKSYSEYSQSNVVGSSAVAGNELNVVARGDNRADVHNGDLTATAAHLAGNNVSLTGNDVILQSGWDTTHEYSKSHSYGGEAGIEIGSAGLSLGANGQGSSQHARGNSLTSVNTTVTASNDAKINASGKTTINGATVSGDHVGVNTGNLDIVTPQDISHYKSNSSQAGASIKIPLGAGSAAGGVSYGNQKIRDNYQSTGKQLSGIYAGKEGVDIHVGDTTHLKAGVISSTAAQSKNHFDTGRLVAESESNQSRWKATATGGGLNLGGSGLRGSLGPLGYIGSNIAANSGLISGTQRKHAEQSISQSAISDNITVHAGSVTGQYATSVDEANGHIKNRFDANRLANELQNSQTGMQLVGEVMGQVSDRLGNSGVWGFDETNAKNNIGRILIESGGSAAIVAVTGGNAGAAVASTVAGKVTGNIVGNKLGEYLGYHYGDNAVTETIGNLLTNAASTGAGAAAGGVVGGATEALNRASIASLINEYNDTAWGVVKKAIQKGGYEKLVQTMEEKEIADHAADGYVHGFPEKSRGYYDANGKINKDALPPDEYHVPTDEELRKMGIDGQDGLSKMLYHPKNPETEKSTNLESVMYLPNDSDNPLTPPMIIFKGTTNVWEGIEDVTQGLGFGSPEYSAAQNIGKEFNQIYQNIGGRSPIFAGNLLGGGLANAAGKITGLNSVTTNAAGLNHNTVNNSISNISYNTYVKGEPLHILQNGANVIVNSVVNVVTPIHELNNVSNIFGYGTIINTIKDIPPHSPINDPIHGTTTEIIPAAPEDKDAPFYQYHFGSVAHRATNHEYDQTKNQISQLIQTH